MMRWIMYVVLAALVAGAWTLYSRKNSDIAALQEQIDRLDAAADPEGKLPELTSKLSTLEGEKTFNGILLTFLGAGLAGIFFVMTVLPFMAQRFTHAVYDSAEMVEKDVMHDARSLLAQGDYEGSIAAFRQAAAAEPENRLPWVEIAKIQKDHLEDADGAIQTVRTALETQVWQEEDTAYFLFRLADLYHEVHGDRASAMAIMQQVIEQFPGTRHSANAAHKLQELEVAEAAAEEQRFIEEQKRRV